MEHYRRAVRRANLISLVVTAVSFGLIYWIWHNIGFVTHAEMIILISISVLANIASLLFAGPMVAKSMGMIDLIAEVLKDKPRLQRQSAIVIREFAQVCRSAKLDPKNFRLFIKPDDGKKVVNAFLTGISHGRAVVIYQDLLDMATEGEEKAVIAHELGHSINAHISAMALPNALRGAISMAVLAVVLIAVAPALFFLGLMISFKGCVSKLIFGLPFLLCCILAFPVIVIAVVLSLPFTLILAPLTTAQSRAMEYVADAYAVQLGFGAELASFLGKLQDKEEKSIPRFVLQIMEPFSSHPLTYKRILRINEQIAEDQGKVPDALENSIWTVVKIAGLVLLGHQLSIINWPDAFPTIFGGVPVAYVAMAFCVFNLDALMGHNLSTVKLSETKLPLWQTMISIIYMAVYWASGLYAGYAFMQIPATATVAKIILAIWVAKPVIGSIGASGSEFFSTLSDLINQTVLILSGLIILTLL